MWIYISKSSSSLLCDIKKEDTEGSLYYDSMCFLEIKKKYKGLVNKRRVAVPMEEAERFLIDGILPSKPNQIFTEIGMILKF